MSNAHTRLHRKFSPSRASALLVAGVAALIAAGCADEPVSPKPVAVIPGEGLFAKGDKGPRTEIAFVTTRTEDFEIFGMKANGGGLVNLTNNPYGVVGGVINQGVDLDPSWSPDGSKIVFWSGRDPEGTHIYIMNADGSGQTKITSGPASDRYPVWSPDGSRIAFVRTLSALVEEIFVMNTNGANLTNVSNLGTRSLSPVWSPDGKKLLFRGNADGNSDIWLVGGDGSGLVNLTNDPNATEYFHTWSPDGSQIAFVSGRDDPDHFNDVYVMSPIPAGVWTRLTTAADDDQAPAWSPDGTKIAFTSFRTGNAEVFVMNANGSGQTNLTNNPAEDFTPLWSPDGSRIGFVRRFDNPFNTEIFVMAANGTKQTNITNHPAPDGPFVWRP